MGGPLREGGFTRAPHCSPTSHQQRCRLYMLTIPSIGGNYSPLAGNANVQYKLHFGGQFFHAAHTKLCSGTLKY